MRSLVYLLFASFFVFTLCSEEFEKSPRVIAHKSIIGQNYIVVEKPWIINHFLVNIGDSDAVNLTVFDFYEPKHFKALQNVNEFGHASFRISRLESKKTFSFNVTVAPLVLGVYGSSRARVRYYNGGVSLGTDKEYHDEDVLIGYTSSIEDVHVLSSEEYFEMFSSVSITARIIVSAAVSATVMLPGLIWLKSTRRL